MAKQAAYKISNIEQCCGQYIQTGRETLEELYTVHFPDSKMIMIQVVVRISRTWAYEDAQQTGKTGAW
jgi:hypothetical protein